MIEAAINAVQQMFTPAFRAVLWKSILLALAMVVLVGIALHRLLSWLAENGGVWAEGALGSAAQGPMGILLWVVSVLAAFGIIIGGVFLMPAVTAFVGSFFVDDIAQEVERSHYPAEPVGEALPMGRAVWEGSKTALVSVLVYLCALPFLLLAGAGLFVMFFAAAYLLGREYFELCAMRFHSVADAKALRKQHRGAVFTAGLFIAAFVSIPIVNLATPLFATAFMVHIYKRIAGKRIDLIEPKSRVSSITK